MDKPDVLKAHLQRKHDWDAASAALSQKHDFSAVSPNRWFERKMVALSVAATGYDPHTDRVVAVAVLETYGAPGSQSDQVARQWILDPGVDSSPSAERYHGVSNEYVRAEGIPSQAAIPEIVDFLREQMRAGIPVLGYDLSFALTLLHEEALRAGVEPLSEDDYIVLDPSVIDGWLDRYRKGKRTLDVVAEVHGVPIPRTRSLLQDCDTVVRLAHKMATAYYPELLTYPETLTSIQRIWRKRWAEDKNSFYASINKDRTFSPYLTVIPRP